MDRKQTEQIEKMKEVVTKFADVWVDLSFELDQMDKLGIRRSSYFSGKYPFDRDFKELVESVCIWSDAINIELDYLMRDQTSPWNMVLRVVELSDHFETHNLEPGKESKVYFIWQHEVPFNIAISFDGSSEDFVKQVYEAYQRFNHQEIINEYKANAQYANAHLDGLVNRLYEDFKEFATELYWLWNHEE